MSQPHVTIIQAQSPENNIPISTSEKIEFSLIHLVYKQAALGLLTSFFCSTVIFIGLFHHVSELALLTWYGFTIVVTLLRTLLITVYFKQEKKEERIRFWKSAFIFGAALGGISWGLTGCLFFPEANSIQQTLVVLILAGTAAGAVPILAGILWAAIVFLTTALFPLIITLLYMKNDINVLFDMTVFVYFSYLIALSLQTHKILKSSVGLQFEKLALLHNLSEAKDQLQDINARLEAAATHDPLTKVANRNLFITKLEAAAKKTKDSKKMLALLYIDLDNFKMVNDIYGHHIGDQLLLVLVERLSNICKKEDLIARLGGDEFTIILENIINPYDVAKICKRICHSVATLVEVNGIKIKITASIGISIFPIDSQDVDQLLSIADKAMYYVKERGGNNYRFNVELLTE
ncbi:MAG: GGDEF domain-containing protein [Gammaproteobacteria bacterium]|nr:GGDEF domain-containing protein [Gammaproteobacteria bacterium]